MNHFPRHDVSLWKLRPYSPPLSLLVSPPARWGDGLPDFSNVTKLNYVIIALSEVYVNRIIGFSVIFSLYFVIQPEFTP